MPEHTQKAVRWRLMLISLLLAVVAEGYFYSADNSVHQVLSAVVEVRNLPRNKMIVEPAFGGDGIPLRIDVRGPRSLVEQLRGQVQRIEMEYPEGSPTNFELSITRELLDFPAGVEVESLQPQNIAVELDDVVTKVVPVRVVHRGEVASGHVLGEVRPTPTHVVLRGPGRDVSRLREVTTEPVDLSGLDSIRSFEVQLDGIPELVVPSTITINAEFQVVPILSERIYESVPVRIEAPSGFAGTVEPSRIWVRLGGPTEALKNLDKSLVSVRVDGRELPEGRHEVVPTGDFPADVIMLETRPQKVQLLLVRTNDTSAPATGDGSETAVARPEGQGKSAPDGAKKSK